MWLKIYSCHKKTLFLAVFKAILFGKACLFKVNQSTACMSFASQRTNCCVMRIDSRKLLIYLINFVVKKEAPLAKLGFMRFTRVLP